ncbi:ParA family protein [Streptomyces sp. NPDC047981]|uniref:ParA family protein n=1 Tax=Streptomyces sp. NPDC047981 TaxID=3154610 RepID=UPI00343388D5
MTLYLPPKYAPELNIPVFLVMNRAGSVGKTTVANTVFTEAALRGWKGLIFDADLQSDMSYWFGYDGDAVPDGVFTIHDLMLGKARLEDVTVPARTRVAAGHGDDAFETIKGLDLVRGDIKMKQADGELVRADNALAVFWLQEVIRTQVEPGKYDFIVIDAPASYGRLSESLLVASTDVITMMKPMRKELRGARALAQEIQSLNDDYDRYDVRVRPTWYCINDAKAASQGHFFTNMQDEAAEIYGDKLLPQIKNAVVVAEAYDAQEPLPIWAPKTDAMKVFGDIADRLGFPAKS